MKTFTRNCALLLIFVSSFVFGEQINKINVISTTVKNLPVYEQVQTFGNLSAVNQVTISSEVAGKVTDIFFKDGQPVKKGVLILQLDNTQAKADLIAAQADLALAKRNYQRYEELSKYGGTTKQQLDKEMADVNAKKATVQQDLNALQKYTLTAPFTGRLGRFLVHAGDYVAIGDKLVTLVNNNLLKVVYALPEDTFSKLKLGQTVIIKTSALSNKQFEGKVSYIAPTIDTNTGTISVQATIKNKDGELSSGMFATVQQIFNKSTALVIPEECVLANLNGTYAYKIKNGKAVKTPIKVTAHINGYTEVTSGLSLGDTIVAEGQQKLSNHTPVEVIGAWAQKHNAQKTLTIHKKMAKTKNS